LKRRNEVRPSNSHLRPLFAWEPVPDLCTPEEYPNFKEAIRVVDIVSPNESELGAFFGMKDLKYHGGVMPSVINTVLETGIGPHADGALVVRLGKDGCYCKRQGNEFHFESYHETIKKATLPPNEFENCRARPVIDPTGGGNTFLGAMAQAMVTSDHQTGDDIDANFGHREDGAIFFNSEHLANCMIWASVAASFVIEQVGLPILSHNEQGEEMWNTDRVVDRMAIYRRAHGLQPEELNP
jgi:sugar/nucleoside kinase (ribokinase family)